MSATAVDALSSAGRDDRRTPAPPSIGLWVFMGVATALFSLFLTAYVMRMSASDCRRRSRCRGSCGSAPRCWSPAAWRLQWPRRRRAAPGTWRARAACCWPAASARWPSSAVQLWAWQALLAAQVMPAGNPAGSFFYLLTGDARAARGGRPVALGGATPPGGPRRELAELAWRIALCARYWHFMLAGVAACCSRRWAG